MNQNSKMLAIVALLGCLGCQSGEHAADSHSSAAFAAKADGMDWMEGDPVRLALAQVREDLPKVDYWSLVQDASIDVEDKSTGTGMNGFTRKGLLFAFGESGHEAGGEHLRVWRYKLGADVPPLLIRDGERTTRLPFRLRGGGAVEFAKAFDTEQEARAADSLDLMDLPHDADSALALPQGAVVSIPITGRAAVDVNGRFLSRAARFSPELAPFATTAVTGTTSGLRRGTLIADGALLMQVIRLSDTRVRLRVSSNIIMEGEGGLDVNAGAMALYHFVPCAAMSRARAIKTRIERARQRIERLGTVEERIARFQERIDGRLRPILNTVTPQGGLVGELGRAVNGGIDWGFETAMDIARSAPMLVDIENIVLDRTERLLDKGLQDWNTYIEPAYKQIRRLSSRTYNLRSTVGLDAEATRRVRTLADYEFDLSDDMARRAFDRAITGRALWLDSKGWLGGGTLEGLRLSDLTLADELASRDAASDTPRVIRHVTALGDIRSKHYGVNVSGLWMGFGMDWDEASNRIELTDADGEQTEWEARAWQLDRKTSWFGQHGMTSFASGAFVEVGQEDLLGGGYWFSWATEYMPSTNEPVAKSLGEFLNLLGPVAARVGVPALYDGEHEGEVSASLEVMFSGDAMDYLFDARLTDDALLWEVFGRVADTFHNRYEIPIIMNPFRPEGLDEIDGAVEACETVAKSFGGWYCNYFQDTFIPSLREAQEATDPQARLDFLEKFYEKGVFGKPVGSRLLVRYVAELMETLGLGEEISIQANVRNRQDDSESASPSFEVGSPEALALIETMTTDGLR